jgi:photosystem II stability/assembly factor-like uncharacterized protein
MNLCSSLLSGNVCGLRRRFGVTRLVCALAILMALFPVAQSNAGLDQWTSNGPANSGPINSLAVDPSAPETVYAGSGIAGMLAGTVFKSTNGGASWAPANNGLPSVFVRALVIDPQTPSTIYAGTSGTFIGPVFRGMFKSIDGGMSWTPLASTPAPASVVSVAIDPQNPAIVYAGTANLPPDTLFKSTNGGTTWAPMSTGLPNGIVNAIVVDPQTSSTVYAGTQFGLFKSINGGASWTPMNNGFTPSSTPSILALVIDPQNTSTVYAGTGGFGVFKSIDGGANWTAASTGIVTNAGVPSGLINALALDPGRPNVLYAATSSSGVFRTINGGSTWTPLNIGLTTPTNQALAISQTGTCLHTGTNNSGATGNVFDFSLVAGCGPLPPTVPPLVAAVLPSSRSVRVGTPATAFVTLINTGSSPAVAASIASPTGLSASFSFQATDPATNQVIGTPNVPVDIPAGQLQTYVIALTPTTSFAPTDVVFTFVAENTLAPAAALTGVNTLLLSSSFSSIPDIVALAASSGGIVNIPETNGTGAFAVATVNVGASGSIIASADTGGVSLPVNLSICQTNPGTGACLGSPGNTVTTTINANDTPTFAVFVQGSGNVPFDPAANRVFVRFNSGGVTRGSTSVAVRTQ